MTRLALLLACVAANWALCSPHTTTHSASPGASDDAAHRKQAAIAQRQALRERWRARSAADAADGGGTATAETLLPAYCPPGEEHPWECLEAPIAPWRAPYADLLAEVCRRGGAVASRSRDAVASISWCRRFDRVMRSLRSRGAVAQIS